MSLDLLTDASPSSCSIWSCTTAWLILEALSVATPARRLVMAALVLSSMEAHASLSPSTKACVSLPFLNYECVWPTVGSAFQELLRL